LIALVGVASEAHFNPSSIHSNTGGYDYLNARQLIDELNALRPWPQLSFENAARRAIEFVEKNFVAIDNLVLVLAPTGELPDSEIRLFSRLPSWRLLP
jgi:hypothetical protein